MRCEKFDLCLIVPFQYDKNWFEQMGNEPGLLEYFEEKEMKSDRLEQKNYKIWNERKHGIMRCFELRQKYRMTIGVYKNENYVYSFCKKDDIHFQISKIYGWFLETGEAFLTLRVSGKDLSEEQMMDLKSMLTRIRERHKIQYSIKTGKDTSEEKCFTMKELIRNFLEKVEFVGPTELKNTYSEAVCLSYGIVEGMEQHHILELSENLKNNIKSARKSSQIIEPEFCYIPREFPYLYWSVSENCLSVLADISQAAEMANENVVFLRDNLGASIFKNYLMFYLYYYSLQVRCLKLETQYQMAGKKMCMYPAKSDVQELETDLVELSDQTHINKLFCEYLCDNTWNMTKRLTELAENLKFAVNLLGKLEAFISYRRIYGGYPARLLYNGLSEKGKSVFYDVSSMRAGDFTKQIKKAIEDGTYVIAVLTPGCLDQVFEDEKDWVRRELAYALKCKKTVINVLVDRFEFPEKLPEDIEKIREQHGVHMSAENIDSAIESVLQLMERNEDET